jgi:hypothetical protein
LLFYSNISVNEILPFSTLFLFIIFEVKLVLLHISVSFQHLKQEQSKCLNRNRIDGIIYKLFLQALLKQIVYFVDLCSTQKKCAINHTIHVLSDSISVGLACSYCCCCNNDNYARDMNNQIKQYQITSNSCLIFFQLVS